MTTIVNSTTPTNDSSGSGLIMGIVIVLGLGILFFYFGLPAIRNMGPIQVNVPAPQVVVPGKINVNVSQTK